MKFIRVIKARDLKIRKTRYGEHIGPLPSINYFSDNSSEYYIDMQWEDKTKSENIARKHARIILLEYIRFNEEEVNYIMDNFFTIRKARRGRGAEIWEIDDFEIEIKGSKDELPGHEKLVRL